ncbi:putative 60S ribosomal protein L37a [Umbelopsis sp. PMI_123]|nr:putative 60S ribosomal protein L37a [Umbelopsis sp. PMI_123]
MKISLAKVANLRQMLTSRKFLCSASSHFRLCLREIYISLFYSISVDMAKRTKKVGVTGKYGTRYGASLRKQVKKMEITQHAKYTCTFCGKDAVKRTAVGIWECKGCKKVMAGGAWQVSTTAAVTVRSAVRRLREMAEI